MINPHDLSCCNNRNTIYEARIVNDLSRKTGVPGMVMFNESPLFYYWILRSEKLVPPDLLLALL
eukprot:2726843-Prymnesium_polylepis.1